jgi:branched-chain amino acid transport system ATP-binding protein
VLLLDEPSLGLSPLLVKEIFAIVRRLNKEEGVSILLVEQNAKVALETADYGYVLEVGRVVMHDSSETLMQSNEIRESYLGQHADDTRAKTRRERTRAAP